MRRILQIPVLGLAVGALTACEPEHVIPTVTPPTAAVRFVHAVPDTGAMDFRFVDILENSAHYDMRFRTSGGGAQVHYKATQAGQRHLRIFMNGTTAEVATTVVKDTVVNLVEGTHYTFLLWGYARPGSAPGMRLTVLEDAPGDPGSQVALRVINAAAGLGALDVYQYPRGTATGTACPGGGVPPAAATWANVAELSASSYVQAAPSQVCYKARSAGGVTDLFTDLRAPIGTAATVDIDAIPGTTVAGSAVTGIIMPPSVAGSSAPSVTTPGVLFVWDRRPPRTCSPLC